MRSIIILLPAIALFMVSCSSSYKASTPYDDVYYSEKKSPEYTEETLTVDSETDTYTSREVYNNSEFDPRFSEQEDEYYYDSDEEVIYYDEEFEMEDYYDYTYAARIRRFHEPIPGYGYYDNYYTNSYFYNYNPYTYGSSIYLGYNWWYPYYGPSLSFGFGWGWPYYNWYYPSYYWGWPYYGGYCCCCYGPYFYGNYWDGYYYNSYDYNSPYYGQRGSRGLNSNGTGQGGRTPRIPGENNEDAIIAAKGTNLGNSNITAVPSASKTSDIPGTSSKKISGKTSGNTNISAKSKLEKPVSITSKSDPGSNTGKQRYTPQNKSKYKSKNTYTRPEKRYSKPKTYQAPEYRKTRSSKEYSSPKVISNRNTDTQSNTKKSYSRPGKSSSNPVYSKPSNINRNNTKTSRSNSKSYKVPSKSNTRSYSTPSRSPSKSYSTPSRSSSRSYSSPSRSSSGSRSSGSRSSGSSSSGKSSGGRGGR